MRLFSVLCVSYVMIAHSGKREVSNSRKAGVGSGPKATTTATTTGGHGEIRRWADIVRQHETSSTPTVPLIETKTTSVPASTASVATFRMRWAEVLVPTSTTTTIAPTTNIQTSTADPKTFTSRCCKAQNAEKEPKVSTSATTSTPIVTTTVPQSTRRWVDVVAGATTRQSGRVILPASWVSLVDESFQFGNFGDEQLHADVVQVPPPTEIEPGELFFGNFFPCVATEGPPTTTLVPTTSETLTTTPEATTRPTTTTKPAEALDSRESEASGYAGEYYHIDPKWDDTYFQLELMRKLFNAYSKTAPRFTPLQSFAFNAVQPTSEGDVVIQSQMRIRGPTNLSRDVFVGHLADDASLKEWEVTYADLNTDDMLYNEYMILRVLEPVRVNGRPIAVRPLFLSCPPSGLEIFARFAVKEHISTTLFDFVSTGGPSVRADQIIKFALDWLMLLKELHSRGFVHGSVSEFSVGFAPGSSEHLVLTDFEYSAFFPETQYNHHYHQRDPPAGPVMLLSPWELETSIRLHNPVPPHLLALFGGASPVPPSLDQRLLTRRDDLYRWIESVARLLYQNQIIEVMKKEAGQYLSAVLKFKKEYPFFVHNGKVGGGRWRFLDANVKNGVKVELGCILSYIRSLDDDEIPRYTYIIDKLRKVHLLTIPRGSS